MSRRIKTGPKLLVFLLLVGGGTWWGYRLQLDVTFHPPRTSGPAPNSIGLRFDEDVVSGPGGELRAWYIPAAEPAPPTTNPAPTILCFHDSGETISDDLRRAQVFHDLGLHVLLAEYRGFGSNPGQPSEAGLGGDALAAYFHLTGQRKVPAARVVLYGRGIGAAVAVELATQVKAAGLILDSAFTSLGDRLAQSRKGAVIPWDLLLKERFASVTRIGRVNMPVLLLHATRDPVVPLRQVERLYGAAHAPKELVKIENPPTGQPLVGAPASREALQRFLAEHAGLASGPAPGPAASP